MPTFPKPLPDAEFLHECFRLDVEKGQLFWKERPRRHFTTDQAFLAFQTRSAGKRADAPAPNGYYRVRIRVAGKDHIFGAHRVIWKMVHGRDPFPEVDHDDRDISNNRPSNLLEATRIQNRRNQARAIAA